ncbi:hypothetical protein THF5H11_140010 [Vibrio jasicida]|nr:hypothetical protein THF5H11_140010 [Vibrio jasicida]
MFYTCIFKQMHQANESCGYVFGVGEDDMVRELYSYARVTPRGI